MGNVNWITDCLKERNTARRPNALTTDDDYQAVLSTNDDRNQTLVRPVAMRKAIEEEGPSPAKRAKLSDQLPESSSRAEAMQRPVTPLLSQCSSMVSNVTHSEPVSETDFYGSGEDSDYDPGHPIPPVSEMRPKRYLAGRRQITTVLNSDPDN